MGGGGGGGGGGAATAAATTAHGDGRELLMASGHDLVDVLAGHLLNKVGEALLSVPIEGDVHGRQNLLAVSHRGRGVSADNRQHVSTDDLHVFKHKCSLL